jgi:Prokaryotic E2 family E
MSAEEEISELIEAYGGAVETVPGGQRYLVLEGFPLGGGWTPAVTRLAIHITGYPEAALDGFYVPGDVRLASGAQPTNASLSSVLGNGLWWALSYHASGWRTGHHNLKSFIGLVRQRFADVR